MEEVEDIYTLALTRWNQDAHSTFSGARNGETSSTQAAAS